MIMSRISITSVWPLVRFYLHNEVHNDINEIIGLRLNIPARSTDMSIHQFALGGKRIEIFIKSNVLIAVKLLRKNSMYCKHICCEQTNYYSRCFVRINNTCLRPLACLSINNGIHTSINEILPLILNIPARNTDYSTHQFSLGGKNCRSL